MNTSKPKILIIGAGIAGLAAGNYLQENSCDVTLLEARDRCGGRIWTDDSLGRPFDRGAAWIHGVENNPIAALAKRFSARYLPVEFKQFCTFDHHQQLIPPSACVEFNNKLEEKLSSAKQFALQSPQDISLAAALKNIGIEDFKSFTQKEKILFKRKLLYFENFYGASYQFLSARHWDIEKTWPGDNCIMLDSYRPIVAGLSKNCKILFNNKVNKIKENLDNIEVITENDHYFADAVLVTLPLGVLKKASVIFEPSLPEVKQRAIEKLGMGIFNIIALKFSKVFWPQTCQAMFFSTFDTLLKSAAATGYFNFEPFVKQPILVTYKGGEAAKDLENYSDAEIIEKIMQPLKLHFVSNSMIYPEAYSITRWSQDPFSYGSYSYVAVGASGEDYAELAKPASNKLFFAGEATSREYPATTHGAYLSGVREAERIVALYKN